MTGHDLIAALQEITDPLARDQMIVEATQLGLYDSIQLLPVESVHGGDRATFFVAKDPVRFGGERVNVSARTQQRIADAMKCTLPTPKLMHLMQEQALVKVESFTRSTIGMLTPAAQTEASRAIDERIAAAVKAGADEDALRTVYAKSWCLTRAGLTWPHHVPNVGLARDDGSFIQGPQPTTENAHNLDHHDYSQDAYLLFGECTVNGENRFVADIAADPTLCKLICDDGPLPSFRLPFVALEPADAPKLDTPLDVDWSGIPFIEAMHYVREETRTPRLCVLHTMQTQEGSKDAPNIATWLKTGPFPNGVASVHWLVDHHSIVRGVPEEHESYGAKGANPDGIHIEVAGSAYQTHAQWADPYSNAALLRAAAVTAQACKRWNIPVRWVRWEELRDGHPFGITSHASVSRGRKISTHQDPGISFPVIRFLRMVEEALCLLG